MGVRSMRVVPLTVPDRLRSLRHAQRTTLHHVRWPHRLTYRSARIDAAGEEGVELQRDIFAPVGKKDEDRIAAWLEHYEELDGLKNVKAEQANLLSSLTVSGLHAPVLDIDFEAQLRPSRTKGHYHLYLDREIPWWRYVILLWALAFAGIIERGYFKAALRQRMTLVRWKINMLDGYDAEIVEAVLLEEMRQRVEKMG